MKLFNSTIRFRYFGIGPVLAALFLAVSLTVVVWPSLRWHEKYVDPVAGAIIWSDYDKSHDTRTLMFLVVSSCVFTLALTAGCWEMAPEGPDSEIGNAINQLLLLSLVPAGWRLAVSCMNAMNEVPPVRFLALFPLGAVVIISLISRYRKQLTKSDIYTIGGAMLIAPLMAAFSAMGILVTITRTIPIALAKVASIASGCIYGSAGVAVIAIFVLFALSPTLEVFRNRLIRCLMICQFAVPLLFMYLVPPPIQDLSHQFRTPFPTALVITIAVIIFVCHWRMYRRFKSAFKIEDGWILTRAIAPVAVAAISVYTMCGIAMLPTISRDYFHTGEQMIPWQQLWEFHRVPYVDFVPIHGAMSIVRGMFDQVFFDGGAGNYSTADVLLSGIAAAVTAIAASTLITPLGALFLAMTVLPELDRMWFVAAPLFLIANPRLLEKPVKWLAAWLVIGLIACAYNAAMGPAFVVGTSFIALWQIIRGFRTARGKLFGLIAISIAIAAIIGFIPLFREIVIGFVKFLLDNHWTNEAATGIAWVAGAWKRSRTYGFGSSQILWEVVRHGWLPVTFAAAAIYWREWSKPSANRRLPAMVLSAAIPPVMLLSSAWVIERIEPGFTGRSGALTDVAALYLAPSLVFLTMPKKYVGLFVLMAAVFVGLINPNGPPTGIDPKIMVMKTFTTRSIPANAGMVDGNVLGLAHLGQVIKPNPDFTADIVKIRDELAKYLKPNETFFDLSDETALYFYLNKPIPVQYAAYVASNSRLQNTLMRQLHEHPVPLVLIQPSGWIDEVPLSIRCYRPYHDYVLKFPAVVKDPFVFLVDPARLPEPIEIGSESQLKILDKIFAREDLLRLPLAWGGSFASMKDRYDSIAKAKESPQSFPLVAGQTPSLTWNIPEKVTLGKQADFLRLHINFDPADRSAYRSVRREDPRAAVTAIEPELVLTWANEKGNAPTAIRFKAGAGDLIIPLGSYPRWLLGSGFKTLTLTLQNPPSAKQLTVSELEFLRLKE